MAAHALDAESGAAGSSGSGGCGDQVAHASSSVSVAASVTDTAADSVTGQVSAAWLFGKPASPKPRVATVFNPPAMWMLLFGSALAACAGMVDAIGFLSLNGALVTHVSGTTARIGMHLEGVRQGEEEAHFNLRHATLQVACFMLGAFLCGLVIPKMTLSFGKKSFYGLALLGESALLVATWLVAPADVGAYLASVACGLQNAMCTMHFGAVVRTTHVTGTLTDIGSTSGRAVMLLLRHGFRYGRLSDFDKAELAADWTKLRVLLPLYLCFLIGAFAGAWLGTHWGAAAFLVPAAVTGSLGLLYTFFKRQLKRQFERLELRRLGREVALMEAMLEQSSRRRVTFGLDGKQGEGQQGASAKKAGPGGNNDEDEEDEGLEERVEYMLRVVEDVEATVGDLPQVGRIGRSNTAEF